MLSVISCAVRERLAEAGRRSGRASRRCNGVFWAQSCFPKKTWCLQQARAWAHVDALLPVCAARSAKPNSQCLVP